MLPVDKVEFRNTTASTPSPDTMERESEPPFSTFSLMHPAFRKTPNGMVIYGIIFIIIGDA